MMLAKDIEKRKEDFSIVLRDGSGFKEDRVIIGYWRKGNAFYRFRWNGYDLAKNYYKIVDVFPGLVQLKLAGIFFQ